MENARAANFPAPRVVPNPKARLLDQVREVIRVKHYSITTQIYTHVMHKPGLGVRNPLDF